MLTQISPPLSVQSDECISADGWVQLCSTAVCSLQSGWQFEDKVKMSSTSTSTSLLWAQRQRRFREVKGQLINFSGEYFHFNKVELSEEPHFIIKINWNFVRNKTAIIFR